MRRQNCAESLDQIDLAGLFEPTVFERKKQNMEIREEAALGAMC